MKKGLILFLSPLCCLAQAPAPAVKDNAPTTQPAAEKATATQEADQKAAAQQAEKLALGIKLAKSWQEYARHGQIREGMALWGYAAFDGVSKDSLILTMETQLALLGPVSSSDVLEDRSLVDLEGTAPGSQGEAKGVYVTLSFLNNFQKGLRRETIFLFQPPGGEMKITGVRREELPSGKQGAAELATDLGQLALLKLRGAPRERWEPWQREATALAEILKLTLPPLPESTNGGDKGAGEKLAALVMVAAPPLFDKLGEAGGMHEAKAILNAFALLLLYEPGDETCTRLAVLSGAEAEKAKLPAALWKPLIRAVSEKEKLPGVNEAVMRLASGVAAYLAEQDVTARVKSAPKLVLEQALASMEIIPTYSVRGEFTAQDGRKSTMTANLGPGAIYLQLEGFDGKKESRLATPQGCHVSHDEEKTWLEDSDLEGITGLCRTLQAPLDRSKKFTETYAFHLTGVESLDKEQLFRFQADAPEAPAYWVLMSKNGPVVRRATMKMKFGDTETTALLIYTKLGKEVNIPELELLPPPK